MEVVIILSSQWNVAPFETLKTDIDDFILLLNHYMNVQKDSKTTAPKADKNKRIKVDDRTATGGWF